MKILILYDSYHGHTAAMAREVAAGAEQVAGAEVRLKTVSDAQKDDLLWAEGMAVGSPTHMGSIGWQMKRFIDHEFSALWGELKLAGKVGAVFTTGGAGGAGGAELAQLSLLANYAQQGMVIVTHPHNSPGYRPDGLPWGPSWSTGRGGRDPTPAQISSARALGQRLAEVTGRLHNGAR